MPQPSGPPPADGHTNYLAPASDKDTAKSPPAARPNVVVILVDDMGYGDFGAFGNPDVETPALDHLASEGLRLTQHYAGSAVCAPSRAALMTGRYPHRTGAIDTLEGRGLDRLGLSEMTLGDLFKGAGYATGLIGKWHLGALDPRYHPNARGFDEFAGFRGGWSDYYQWRLDRNGTLAHSDGRYLTDVFADEAAAFIDRHAKAPFFLHVTFNAPHFPLQVPDDELAPFLEKGQFSEGVCRIYAMNRRMDRGVERILDALRRHGLEENTLVLFTSDNGPQFGRHDGFDLDRHNGHFNGSKGTVYEGGIRVPAMVRWPAGLGAGGAELGELIHFTDWLPTLTAAAGIAPPEDVALDGQNVLRVLQGEGAPAPQPRFWQWNRYTPVASCNAAMRDGPWKLLRPAFPEAMQVAADDRELDRRLKYEDVDDINHDPWPVAELPDALPAPLLFNLDEDPCEQHDLADIEPDRLARMQRELDRWFEAVECGRARIGD